MVISFNYFHCVPAQKWNSFPNELVKFMLDCLQPPLTAHSSLVRHGKMQIRGFVIAVTEAKTSEDE
jgi:hypothetical protein